MNEHSHIWSLQEAKAKFSEVVRLAQSNGPQTVTVHGRPVVVIEAVTDPSRDRRKATGKDFWEALAAGPKFDLKIPARPKNAKFRDVDL